VSTLFRQNRPVAVLERLGRGAQAVCLRGVGVDSAAKEAKRPPDKYPGAAVSQESAGPFPFGFKSD
jgi:hypothetical protein